MGFSVSHVVVPGNPTQRGRGERSAGLRKRYTILKCTQLVSRPSLFLSLLHLFFLEVYLTTMASQHTPSLTMFTLEDIFGNVIFRCFEFKTKEH